MLNTTTFVGLDVHARSIKAVALDAMTGEVRTATFGYDAAEVAEWVRSLDPAAKCVYESGVTGFESTPIPLTPFTPPSGGLSHRANWPLRTRPG